MQCADSNELVNEVLLYGVCMQACVLKRYSLIGRSFRRSVKLTT
jgi:hypothetical protein